MRAFLAVELPGALQERLAAAQASLRESLPGVRWVRAGSIHLTLHFLGEVEEETAERIAEGAREVCSSLAPGRARGRGLGWFPPRGAPRVIWAGVAAEGEDVLAALHRGLEPVARVAGRPPERRGFSPHLTLGRAARLLSRAAVEQAVRSLGEPDFGVLPVERCTLLRSTLGPGGARYELQASWALGG